MFHSATRIGQLTYRTVGTYRTVWLAEPVILLAVHRILLSPVQTVITPMIHPSLKFTSRTSARSIPNMMTFIPIIMGYWGVTHRTTTKRLVVFQVFFMRAFSVLRFFVAVAAKLAQTGRTTHNFLFR